MAKLENKQRIRPTFNVGQNAVTSKISNLKTSLPPKTGKSKVGNTETLSSKMKSEGMQLNANEAPICVVLEGSADLTSDDGLSATGVESLISGASTDMSEESHQIRYVKSFVEAGKTYLPQFVGVFYAILLTLTLADATSFDSQEVKIYTTNSSDSGEQMYNILVQPKTRNVKLLILSSRSINSERVLFPSKAAGKAVGTSKYFAEIEGANCTATAIIATPRELSALL